MIMILKVVIKQDNLFNNSVSSIVVLKMTLVGQWPMITASNRGQLIYEFQNSILNYLPHITVSMRRIFDNVWYIFNMYRDICIKTSRSLFHTKWIISTQSNFLRKSTSGFCSRYSEKLITSSATSFCISRFKLDARCTTRAWSIQWDWSVDN